MCSMPYETKKDKQTLCPQMAHLHSVLYGMSTANKNEKAIIG